MTLLRRLAVKISGFVVSHASAGSREWAEGLARETEEIRGDWAALGWALGSLRVLFDRRGLPIQSLDEVPALAHKLAGSGRGYQGAVLMVTLQASLSALRVFTTHTRAGRIGNVMSIVGWVGFGLYIYLKRPPETHPEAPIGEWTVFYPRDIGSWTLYYKAELERRLTHLRPAPMCIVGGCILLACEGHVVAAPGGYGSPMLWVLAVFPVALPIAFFYGRKSLRRRLTQLNALLASAGESQ